MAIRIGTRGSELALAQSRTIARALAGIAGEEPVLQVIQTSGDRIADVALSAELGRSFFTREIEEALLAARVDLAVHSLKDLAVESPPGLCLAAVTARAAAGERLLVHPDAHAPGEAALPLARGARVGTASPRRQRRLVELRPDLRVEPLRGNVPTRAARVRERRLDAVLVARAGLDRLGLSPPELVAVDLAIEVFPGAPGQGALALQCRADDAPLRTLLARLSDPDSALATGVERALLAALGGGCNLPLGAHVSVHAGRLRLVAFLFGESGGASRWVHAEGSDPARIVAEAAEQLRPALSAG